MTKMLRARLFEALKNAVAGFETGDLAVADKAVTELAAACEACVQAKFNLAPADAGAAKALFDRCGLLTSQAATSLHTRLREVATSATALKRYRSP